MGHFDPPGNQPAAPAHGAMQTELESGRRVGCGNAITIRFSTPCSQKHYNNERPTSQSNSLNRTDTELLHELHWSPCSIRWLLAAGPFLDKIRVWAGARATASAGARAWCWVGFGSQLGSASESASAAEINL